MEAHISFVYQMKIGIQKDFNNNKNMYLANRFTDIYILCKPTPKPLCVFFSSPFLKDFPFLQKAKQYQKDTFLPSEIIFSRR